MARRSARTSKGFGVTALCAPVAAVVLAGGCRQIAGIHELTPQQSLCTACVDGACASEMNACSTSETCASRLACTLGCDPASADATSCTAVCETQAVPEAATLAAASTCIATSCASACVTTCGDVLPLTPPGAAAACAECVASVCCAEAEACAKDASCVGGLECARGSSTPDTVGTCLGVKYPEGNAAYQAFDACVTGYCPDKCAINQDWSCVGHVVVPTPTADTISTTFQIDDATDPSSPIPGLQAQACAFDDPDCSRPLTPIAVTDATGSVTLTVSTVNASGRTPFDGYLQSSDPAGVWGPGLGFIAPSLSQTGWTTHLLDNTVAVGSTLASLLGITSQPSTSNVELVAVDCAGRYASGVTFSYDAPGTNTVIIYTISGLPSKTATTTDLRGTAFSFNVPLGVATVHAYTDGIEFAHASIVVRANFTSALLIGPTP